MRIATRRKVWLVSGLTVLLLVVLALVFSRARQTLSPSPASPPVSQTDTPKPGYVAPDLRDLATRMAAVAPPPSAEHLAEQRRIELEQIAQALESLNSVDPVLRRAGAEQLGAYPGPEARRALAQALRDDADPAVRLAAATSLGRVRAPDEAVIKALLAAIGQPGPDIAFMALNTLGAYLRQPGLPAGHRRQIRAGLERWRHTRTLDRELRESVNRLLAAP